MVRKWWQLQRWWSERWLGFTGWLIGIDGIIFLVLLFGFIVFLIIGLLFRGN